MSGRAFALLAAVGVLLVAASGVSSRPVDLRTIRRPAGLLSEYFYADSCPQLETTVRTAVSSAVQQNVRLTAGLLRLFFHDCFPQGCDASILLDNGERNLAPNLSIQQEAVQLVEDIRVKVHAACGGATVSCADITVLATRDAVALSGGPSFAVPLGRLDSAAPANSNDVFALPPPTATVDQLLAAFAGRNLTDPADLVALSGAHTVGKARCSSFGDVVGPATDDITRCVTATCSSASGNGSAGTLRDLDFLTPAVFDNLYFIELMLKKNKGVMLPSDQGLATDSRTSWLVQGFADNHWWFFDQFGASMVKMSKITGPQGNVGEIRKNSCFRTNSNSNSNSGAGAAAAAGGVAASA